MAPMKSRHIVLVLLFLLSIITYVDRVCISVAGPRMQQDLGITPDKWGWVVGVFAIAYAAFEIRRKYAGAVSGAMNTAGQIGSFLTFGYLVDAYGTYNAPLVSMSAMLIVSAALWLKIDPT